MTSATKIPETIAPLSRRESNVAARRQRILESARTLLAKDGRDGLSMRKLAKEADLSVTTLYNLVGSREDILRALIEDSAERFDTTVTVPASSGDSIARAMEAREKAGVKGSLATARCAAELAQMCGEAGDVEERLAAHASQVKPTIGGLGKKQVDDQLFPREVPGELRQIFERLGDRIAKHVGIDLRRYGVGRGERLSKNDPVAQMIFEVAEQMGVDSVDIYRSRKQPRQRFPRS